MKTVHTLDDLRAWTEPHLRYAVLGDPVAHSASPAMQNAAFEACGLADRYCRLHISPAELEEAIVLLPKAGFLGVNLTIPHKQQVLPFLQEIDGAARRLGAVNTVVFRDGISHGRNTDGPGIVQAIWEAFGKNPADLRVLIVGAGGGAGRAIATQCAIEGCPEIYLINRSVEKIIPLAGTLQARAFDWSEASFAETLDRADLVINASAVGMAAGDFSPVPVRLMRPETLFYDTIYVGGETPLQRAAREVGARSANGFSLLLHQGALAFSEWTGLPAPLEIMRAALFARA